MDDHNRYYHEIEDDEVEQQYEQANYELLYVFFVLVMMGLFTWFVIWMGWLDKPPMP